DPVAAVRTHLEEGVVGVRRALWSVGVDVPIRLTPDPGVLRRGVARGESQGEADAGFGESDAQPRQAVLATEAVGWLVGADRGRRPDDVVVRAVGEEGGALLAHGRGRAPHPPAAGADRPGCRQPDEVETEL